VQILILTIVFVLVIGGLVVLQFSADSRESIGDDHAR
jgi:hypothetical protein